MNSGKLKVMLELLGSVAVLVGLIFVGLELRQNTAAVEAASLQNQTDSSTNFLMLVASDPDLARLWMAGSNNPGKLDEIDTFRFLLLARGRWLRMQNAFLQWRRGMLTDEDWALYEGLVCEPETTRGIQFQSTWNDHRKALVESFVDFVEACWAEPR